MRQSKYKYRKVLQGWYENWEDLCYYPCNSTGSMDDKAWLEMKSDLKAYRENDPRAYRIVFRRELIKHA